MGFNSVFKGLIFLLTLGTALQQILHTGPVWSMLHDVRCTINVSTFIARKCTRKTFSFMSQYLSHCTAICTARFSHLTP